MFAPSLRKLYHDTVVVNLNKHIGTGQNEKHKPTDNPKRKLKYVRNKALYLHFSITIYLRLITLTDHYNSMSVYYCCENEAYALRITAAG